MSEWTLKRALKLALTMEEESINLYASAREIVSNPGSKKLLKELVKEEEKHKNKIIDAMRDPEKLEDIGYFDTKIPDLKIVNYVKDVTLSPDADYQQILIYAGKREKATHDFYLELAKLLQGTSKNNQEKQIGNMFMKLAQEELKHKYKLEREYDNVILKEM